MSISFKFQTKACKRTHLTKPAAPSHFHKMWQSLCNARKPHSSPSYQTTMVNITLLANEKQQMYFYYSQLSVQFIMEGESLPSVCTCEQGEHVHSMRSADALNLRFQYVSTKPWMVGGITEYQWSHVRTSITLMCDFPQWLPSNCWNYTVTC